MKRLLCAIWLASAAACPAGPITGSRAVALVQAARHAAGLESVAMAAPQRPLPPCAHDPAVAPFQGRWTAVELSCTAPVAWRRVLRTGVGGGLGPERPAGVAPAAARPLLVAARPLRRGDRLAPADLIAADVAGVDPAQAVTDAGAAVGRRLHTAVGQGQPVLERQLEPLLAVEPGQRVAIVARDGQLAVATEGEALGGGGVGDVIRIRVFAGGREIEARVDGPQRVTVGPKIRAVPDVDVPKRRSP